MDLTPDRKKKLTRWIIGIAAACIFIFLGVQNIAVVANALSWCVGLVSPLMIGCGFALILNVPMRFIEVHLWKNAKRPYLQKIRRPIAFLISLIAIVGILAGVVWLVIPELIEAINVVVQGIADFVGQVSGMSETELAELPLGNVLLSIDWDKLLVSLQTWLKNQSGAIVNTAFGTVTSLVGGIIDFFISFVFAVYILFNKDKLKLQGKRLIHAWLPKRFGSWSIHAISVTSANFRNFISGQSLEAVILGILCMLGMWILGFPYAPMVGALIGVTALIPVVGAFIGAGVGAFMILTVEPIQAVFFLVFIIILQQIEENLIYPRVMGSKVNLPGMWVLAAVTVGGSVAGPIGMLLSVPIASTVYVLVKEATLKREKKMHQAL